ncbi:DegQ family serine endoprotease [Chromobacterium sp. IIBBL 290-4]|uniref:DegQ family serine endoprotease n=1 Tax=Chromobacterium sp. IIBBL 290-4 TaxID=2953890 RepID=UPI0020B84CAA|nr:DegQ family serine endoprotease [Chromobacterium sp. IIBBL 290-4]UTH73707.1 DegQ family serine endoprotease [Chromobacterium sp. IIBBL 290-4]
MSVKKLLVSAMLSAFVLSAQLPAAMAADLPDFAQIVDAEGKAVVNISTTSTVKEDTADVPDGMQGDPFFEFFRRFAPPQQREHQESSLGSGFIISADGYVLTNAHVVARADTITVKLNDKREFKAKVIGSDARSDVALLKIEAKSLPVVRLGDPKKLKVGQWVLAIGSPFGFESTATSGIVSGKNRRLPDEGSVQFIQTDAAVNPGNSGGPLFNLSGEVVGINSQIYSRSGGFMGISFAIPIDTAMNVADQLKANGKVTRSRIGVVVQELSKELASSFGLSKPNGALINALDPKGPAQKAGLKAGDIILNVDGQPVENGGDLQRLIGDMPPGKALALDVWRARAQVRVNVVPEELKEEDPRIAQREYRKPGEGGEQSLAQIGLRLQELNPAQLKRAGIDYGLLVRAANGVALRAGIQPGDIIVGVGSDPLKSFAQLKAALEKAKKGDSVALQVMRQGVVQFLPLNPDDGK